MSTWLVTGGAGFIGSHLVETLLRDNEHVVVLDNLSTGYQHNLDDAVMRGGNGDKLTFLRGDLTNPADCAKACEGVDYVLNQAALGSVPRSIANPIDSHRSNVDGFVNMLIAARDAKVKRFVYASSSSVYGDDPTLPKQEARTGRVLSPYAATKHINEVYAGVFQRTYGLETVGLRYFNVFGPRQDPNGAYAAVMPRWMAAMQKGEPCLINGDGSTSRDFCYVKNAVQANLKAATTQIPGATDNVYNIAVGDKTSLLELHAMIAERFGVKAEPKFQDFRKGDIKDSQADISKARRLLGYEPTHTVAQGLDETVTYVKEKRS
ncbi:MAG: LPS biosynthesis protein WbpP [Archangium gephyra]|uniref:LPS biosynthesis protein WbpP n=1 Tax=Archangium gephyra TaxID=48 RepID=A0A2W5SYN4_9BACT|nr:MAG: LPS biosynthesis protein WbpP [Archangium gephyra]